MGWNCARRCTMLAWSRACAAAAACVAVKWGTAMPGMAMPGGSGGRPPAAIMAASVCCCGSGPAPGRGAIPGAESTLGRLAAGAEDAAEGCAPPAAVAAPFRAESA